ncbi:DUF2683 family protein [Epilithonimonas hominis]|uniref:Uncharacterized protein n=1 Tax=Epilithonimonas hominis TaxID=420404 RepID=A0A1H6KIJ7_9FLAO|nr:DUF2683 family protein [Epilithonimonas hominis]ROI11652.1 hypothetical protein EGH73_13125 [Epilithonimonas hominis]SEH72572.1 hypothetical protein SAMN05421793_12336 [Epilithonimonas hominis]
MTSIIITPRNKKELSALKHFIKALDLPYNESKEDISINTITKEQFEKELENSYSIDEFSQKTTQFLQNLKWKR